MLQQHYIYHKQLNCLPNWEPDVVSSLTCWWMNINWSSNKEAGFGFSLPIFNIFLYNQQSEDNTCMWQTGST